MNLDKTVIPTPVPQRPGSEPEQPGTIDPPLSARPVQDDPFSYLPPLYDPEADVIVDSVQGEIRKLLTPEPDSPAPASDLSQA